MVWETILAEFPHIAGSTVLAAIALPPLLLTRSMLSYTRQIRLIHHGDDRLCVWTPSNQDMKMLQQRRFIVTYITGWRAYLGSAQHNYAHWTWLTLPEGRCDLANLERIPGVLPFEIYAQAPLRLISWCSFELTQAARRLLRDLAILCEDPRTTIQKLVDQIALRNTQVQTEQDAAQYLATLTTVHIASRAQMPSYNRGNKIKWQKFGLQLIAAFGPRRHLSTDSVWLVRQRRSHEPILAKSLQSKTLMH